MKRELITAVLVFAGMTAFSEEKPSTYVDPFIGSAGWGNCLPGPVRPFGMVKPGINCGFQANSGYSSMPAPVNGFAQIHMCGAGGGPKYGNIMIQPFIGELDSTEHIFHRKSENASLGYYTSTYEENGITTEIASTHKSVFYQFTFPDSSDKALSVDCGFYLGHENFVDSEENQYLVGSEVEVVSEYEIRGHARVRGGWNRGAAYTVFFSLVSDTPFAQVKTWKNDVISCSSSQSDTGDPVGALLKFADGGRKVKLKIGISNLGCIRAKENITEEMPDWSLEEYVKEACEEWDALLNRIEIDASTPLEQKKMFYTGLYHTMLHPTDKSGECPLWNDDVPYYDDYFALWDTYRTSYPMFSLVYPELSTKLINSMLMIFQRQKYIPDGRSGHWNGRTQGGSNSNIIMSDAFLKNVPGIDWELALKSCLKDADVPPGDIEEAEGRGGLWEYNTLGYIPYGIARSCSRTVDYSICDYSIYLLAKGLGHKDIAERFLSQSSNWKNLWRDIESEGVKGFIEPRNADGSWLMAFHSDNPEIEDVTVTPDKNFLVEWPAFTYYWGTTFYEGTSWQYSLAVPHDVFGLVEMCGGAQAFENRLDIFFSNKHFDVSNEPSFVIPCLYHWIGKPWKTSDCIRKEVLSRFSANADGIPGNDDTGAMSSWLDFHMLGLYPIAGQDLYLIYSPVVKSSTLHLPGGDFIIKAENLSEKNIYIKSAKLNGKPYPFSSLRHKDIASGGELILMMGSKPSDWGKSIF